MRFHLGKKLPFGLNLGASLGGGSSPFWQRLWVGFAFGIAVLVAWFFLKAFLALGK
jgi:hypothetical protein